MDRRGWMIEKLWPGGHLSGLVVDARTMKWVTPRDGTLFPCKDAALSFVEEWSETFDAFTLEINEHVFTD